MDWLPIVAVVGFVVAVALAFDEGWSRGHQEGFTDGLGRAETLEPEHLHRFNLLYRAAKARRSGLRSVK